MTYIRVYIYFPIPYKMFREMFTCLLVIFVMCVCVQCAAGAGVFELQILEFSNYRLELASGACCGGGAPAPPPPASPTPAGAAGAGGGACARPCRTRFSLCLKEYQSVAAPGACSFGREDSPVLGTDSFTLAEPLYTLALPFSFRWTVSGSPQAMPRLIARDTRLMRCSRVTFARNLSRSRSQRSFTLVLQAFDDYEYPEPGECRQRCCSGLRVEGARC